jgi:hypothetical protein
MAKHKQVEDVLNSQNVYLHRVVKYQKALIDKLRAQRNQLAVFYKQNKLYKVREH